MGEYCSNLHLFFHETAAVFYIMYTVVICNCSSMKLLQFFTSCCI